MNNERVRRCHGERGASLILAIAFMVVIGGISAAVIATTTSGVQDRAALDQARNREYAADSAIERSIVRVRGLANPGTNPTECSTPDIYQYPAIADLTFNGSPIRVDCANSPSVSLNPAGSPVSESNLSFAACAIVNGVTTTTCTPQTAIINAHINFQVVGTQVATFVQSWSVNG